MLKGGTGPESSIVSCGIEQSPEEQLKDQMSKSETDEAFRDKEDTLYDHDDYGYNEESAEEILTYASNNLWRDS